MEFVFAVRAWCLTLSLQCYRAGADRNPHWARLCRQPRLPSGCRDLHGGPLHIHRRGGFQLRKLLAVELDALLHGDAGSLTRAHEKLVHSPGCCPRLVLYAAVSVRWNSQSFEFQVMSLGRNCAPSGLRLLGSVIISTLVCFCPCLSLIITVSGFFSRLTHEYFSSAICHKKHFLVLRQVSLWRWG